MGACDWKVRTFEIHSAEIEPNHATTASVSNFASGRKSQEAPACRSSSQGAHAKAIFWVPGVHSNLPAPLVCWCGHAQIAALLSSTFPARREYVLRLHLFGRLSLARSRSSQLTERESEWSRRYGNRAGACNNYDKRSRRKVLNIAHSYNQTWCRNKKRCVQRPYYGADDRCSLFSVILGAD